MDRVIVRPGKQGLPLDVLLFDRHGTFIGPVEETQGSRSELKYAVKFEGNSILRTKSTSLKAGDPVFYYCCDRNSTGECQMQDELTLIQKKTRFKEKRTSENSRGRNQVLQGVIEKMRDMKLDSGQEGDEDCMEEELRSTSKNTRSIASVVLNSNYNKKFICNRLEKQKAKRYRRTKANMLGIFDKLPNLEDQSSKEQAVDQMEDELELGKRKPHQKRGMLDSLVNRSTDYSKNSWEATHNNSSNEDKLTLSERSSVKMLSEPFQFSSILPQSEEESQRLHFFMQGFPSTHE